MHTTNGDILASYIDKTGIWLGINHCGTVVEIHLNPEEAEKLIHDLAGQVFRITGAYTAVISKGHPKDLEATNDLAKRLLSGVIKEK